jgi:hypothetical protein
VRSGSNETAVVVGIALMMIALEWIRELDGGDTSVYSADDDEQ